MGGSVIFLYNLIIFIIQTVTLLKKTMASLPFKITLYFKIVWGFSEIPRDLWGRKKSLYCLQSDYCEAIFPWNRERMTFAVCYITFLRAQHNMALWREILASRGYFTLRFVVLPTTFILECIETKIWTFLRALFVVFFADSVMGKPKLNKGTGKRARSSSEDEVRRYKTKVFVTTQGKTLLTYRKI